MAGKQILATTVTLATILLAPALAAIPQSKGPAASRAVPLLVWDARAVEHLYNRAGFGARSSEIEAGVALGQAALVEKLLSQRADVEPFFYEKFRQPEPREMRDLPQEERQARLREMREKEGRQLIEYTAWWLERMAGGEDPLLERMVLFWHGFFTSSAEEVKPNWLLIQQNQLVREKALGSYADLLASMAKDPAMLTYLDNQVNRKGKPNENLARELMELFSLGVGNYSEDDVKEAARALTGRGVSPEGAYQFHPRLHDDGVKKVLGVQGRLDGEQLVAILLKQDACPRWVARRLLACFEGVEPGPERLADYAAFLRKNDYELQPFLRRLFLDPAFYRAEVVGARVQGPVDYMVGLSRRLGARVPPIVLGGGAMLLGQRLFWPPSVKGWDEGESWITTASLMQRGNLAGFVLGVVRLDDVVSGSDMDEPPAPGEVPMQPGDPGAMGGEPPMQGRGAGKSKGSGQGMGMGFQALRRAEGTGWAASINFTARMGKAGARKDLEITERMLDDLLAIRAPDDTRIKVREFLAKERTRLGIEDGGLLDAGARAEHLLRRLAHLILSLPEAQLG